MARQLGSKNKVKLAFREALRKLCTYKHADPHVWMVHLLAKKGVKSELKLQAAKELAQYLEPKLKAVEITGDVEKPLHVVMGRVTVEERALRQARIAELEAKRQGERDAHEC